MISRNKRSLTLQEVELTGGGVEAHEVEAAGGSAAASLSRRLPGGQTLQHAALPGSVQTEDEDLPLPTLLFLLQVESKDSQSPERLKNWRQKLKHTWFIQQRQRWFAQFYDENGANILMINSVNILRRIMNIKPRPNLNTAQTV